VRSSSFLLAAFLCLAPLWSSPVRAQASDPATTAAARSLFERGAAAADAGDHATAADPPARPPPPPPPPARPLPPAPPPALTLLTLCGWGALSWASPVSLCPFPCSRPSPPPSGPGVSPRAPRFPRRGSLPPSWAQINRSFIFASKMGGLPKLAA